MVKFIRLTGSTDSTDKQTDWQTDRYKYNKTDTMKTKLKETIESYPPTIYASATLRIYSTLICSFTFA